MDKTQLKNFVSLAHTLNFSTTAKQQFISQPALTKQITRLEGELGVRLFHRTKHGVSLTHAGAEFYNYAVEILDSISRAERRMIDIRNGCTGLIKISAVTTIESQVTKYVAEFNRRYPEVQISLDSGTGTQQIMAINKKAFDIYFSFESLLKSGGALCTFPLEPDNYAFYISDRHSHLLDEKGYSGLKKLSLFIESRADGPFLVSQTLALLTKLGLASGSMVYYPSTGAILMAVQAGLGYAVLPSKMNLNTVPEGVRVLPIAGEESVIRNAVGWHQDTENAAALKFIDLVRELN